MKNKVYYILAVAVLLFTPVIISSAAGKTPLEKGWGKRTGRIVYQTEDAKQEIVFDTMDLQKLYEFAK